jgi:aminoglycoside phosphotransferase (APT) family kinase protein
VQRPADIESLRSSLGTTLGRILAIAPIESGTSGESYWVDTDRSRYVAKLFSSDSDVLLGPRAQFDLLDRLLPAGIAPRPAAYDQSAGLLVTEYIADAAAVGPDEIRKPKRIRQIAGLLGRLHRTAVDAPIFDPEACARRYFARLGGLAGLSPSDRQRAEDLLELAASPDPGSPCLCHNDLTADNILFGRAPMLIDFDYAGLAPPVFDLASVTVMNDFTLAQERELLNAYDHDAESRFNAAEFAKVQRLIRLLSHFWSLASPDAEAAMVSQYRMTDV